MWEPHDSVWLDLRGSESLTSQSPMAMTSLEGSKGVDGNRTPDLRWHTLGRGAPSAIRLRNLGLLAISIPKSPSLQVLSFGIGKASPYKLGLPRYSSRAILRPSNILNLGIWTQIGQL
ncbi:hypothetical protein O5D80_008631 [Batrachochytrium dendrobatidis]|nr:hypothetical protein O5D80_008631 [Batrachochytrium dendrobatidis]